MRIEDILLANALKYPNKTLVSNGRQKRTYGQIEKRSNRLANVLTGKGICPGDRIAVILPNCLEMVDIMFATAKSGSLMTPLNSSSALPEINRILEDCQPRAIIAKDDTLSKLMDGGLFSKSQKVILISTSTPDRQKDSRFSNYEDLLNASSPQWFPGQDRLDTEPWLLAYTSGTTGRPKGACLSHRSKGLCCIIEALEYETTSNDNALVNTPMFHAHALVCILSAISAGGALRIMERFDPERTLHIIKEEKISEHDSAGMQLPAVKWLVEEKGAIMIGSDTSSLEMMQPPPPGSDSFMPVHNYLLIEQGVHIAEFHYLEDLAAEKVYQFLYIGTTNKIKGTTAGFAMRPLAIF